jgi:Magnesium chelatase, subunit ChlI
MTLAEAINTTRIHRVAGLTGERTTFVRTRLFRAPHQTISDVGLIAGGEVPMLAEVSLAHCGIPCLDELPEFRPHVLKILRQPLENGLTKRRSPAPPRPPRAGRPGGADEHARGLAHDRMKEAMAAATR